MNRATRGIPFKIEAIEDVDTKEMDLRSSRVPKTQLVGAGSSFALGGIRISYRDTLQTNKLDLHFEISDSLIWFPKEYDDGSENDEPLELKIQHIT